MDADFSGWATKAGLRCSDGRTIMKDAFKHQDKMTVPLVWQHGHNDPENVLGHAILENRDEGVYTYGFFNDTTKGQAAKQLVEHKDVKSLSIFANNLVERSKNVLHGVICEVSLVLKGANAGAVIENVRLAHSYDDGEDVLDDAALIFTGLELEHADYSDSSDDSSDGETAQDVYDTLDEKQKELVHYMIGEALHGSEEDVAEHAAGTDTAEETVQDVYNTLTDKQKQVVQYMIGVALESAGGSAQHSDTESDDASDDESDDESENLSADDADADNEDDKSDDESDNNDEGDLEHQEGTEMTRNVFEQNGSQTRHEHALTHDDLVTFKTKMNEGATFKQLVLAHAQEYGVTDIDLLFPDAQALTNSPDFIARRMEWVAAVLGGTKHSPFAKVKSLQADITADEARAKGYTKGNRKTEEVFGLLRRTTGPATIYKKQKLDRDDILDITDIDVVNWLKAEMRLMIEEELARAILVGDGRSAMSEDKIKDPAGAVDGVGIRSILNDDPLYAIKVDLAANVNVKDSVKGLVRARTQYRGSGTPTLFISDGFLTDLMLDEDKFGRPMYETQQALADKLRVREIVPVTLFDEYDELVAIMVNLQDYTIGANRGGELTSFEDFDIDFNQQKYLQETRLSGGLTKPFSAIVVRRAAGTEATPTAPSFDGTTNTITVPTVAGVSYFNAATDEEMTGDVVITSETEVDARADDGYYLPYNTTRSWTYTP